MDDITLDMDIETVRALGYRIVDMIVGELSDPSKRSPMPPAQSDEVLAMFDGPLPHEGTEPDELLSIINTFAKISVGRAIVYHVISILAKRESRKDTTAHGRYNSCSAMFRPMFEQDDLAPTGAHRTGHVGDDGTGDYVRHIALDGPRRQLSDGPTLLQHADCLEPGAMVLHSASSA